MAQRIAVVDPGSGNLASVVRAFEKSAEEHDIEAVVKVVTAAADLRMADRIVLPGQGAFAACRRGLDALPGMVDALEERVRGHGVPFLGICVGMQLMGDRGLEHGETPGLGWIPGTVTPMDPRGIDGAPLPLPQMGWNALSFEEGHHPVLDGVNPGDQVYFVHSFAFEADDPKDVAATADYGGPVTAIIARGNLAGLQFHVEKSGPIGLVMLANFMRWEP
ncbi:imidazole glycerol phosphate synthase subunit HisH [Roseomonas terrae]|uniref:Imidazole glycerol phosphate synthase subunit HisH n=1 Tax=Neoroseomonas terrae TaxID=424799 RepID=A0ABS5ENM3_9PROT|nr:imidazole glycerol phosphate synthase subunit HisH [Neoroseomonas terrae]MBR0652633.1 imidazole glycerol phosphate synthase subunit HisH [Neoroseomonas terrae]